MQPTMQPTRDNRQIQPASHQDPLENLKKYQDIKEKSKQKYQKQFDFLVTPISQLQQNIDNIKSKREAGLMMYSTFRHYKASLLFGLSHLYAIFQNPDLILDDEQRQLYLSYAYDTDEKTTLNTYLEVLSWAENDIAMRNELDNISLLSQKSSSYKAKFVDEKIYEQLQNAPDRLKFLKQFFYFNICLGLRPSEWFDVVLVKASTNFETIDFNSYSINPHQNQIYLKVSNGKNSFGRACGDFRLIGLDGYGQEFISQLNAFVKEIKAMGLDEVHFDKFLKNKGLQLSRFLKANRVCQKIIHRQAKKEIRTHKDKSMLKKILLQITPTMYSSRHQAICNARQAGLNEIEIASLFGHISVDTAKIHYGNAWKGKAGQFKAKPHPQNLKIVIDNLTEYQDNRLNKTKQKTKKLEQVQRVVPIQESTTPKPSI